MPAPSPVTRGSTLFPMKIWSAAPLLIALWLPSPLAAQAADTTDSPSPRTVRVWLSLGLGPGEFYDTDGVSARASITGSLSRAVVMVRATGSFEGIDGHSDHSESSILGGVRLGGKSLSIIPALGIGKARWTNDLCTAHITCTPEVAAQYVDEGIVAAYDVGVHASYRFIGIAANFTGAAGSPKRLLRALVLSVELGVFGK